MVDLTARRPNGRVQGRRPHPDGIFGRLTYIPAKRSGDVGELRKPSAQGRTPNFQQVTPFTQWCPPARTIGPQPGNAPPYQTFKSQRNWLLKNHPEAFLADLDTESLLAEEISTGRTASQPAAPDTARLLAVGEIADVRDPSTPGGRQVLAFAAGESGHILRLKSLVWEEWAWDEKGVKVRLSTPNSRFEGDWCQDSLPILMIKFAHDPSPQNSIRWLLVQKATSTTVYEPELRRLPVKVPQHVKKPTMESARIFANPLFTIRQDQTGGSSHSDVAFQEGIDETPPQLAIIDQSGYWSVWDIVGHRAARPSVLKPVLRICGNISLGTIPRLPRIPITDQEPHRIMWLSLKKDLSRSPSKQLSSTPKAPLSRSRTLLLCNSTGIFLLDTETGTQQPASDVVLLKSGQHILDIAPSMLDPSQAFVLTNTNVFWTVAKRDNKGNLSLTALVSLPHRKDDGGPSLRLEVSPGTHIDGAPACFVCVRSAQDPRLTIVWFISAAPRSPIRYHRELVHLRAPSNFIGMGMLPVPRLVEASQARQARKPSKARFFQLLTLGYDLDVNSSLCVWIDESDSRIRPPDTFLGREESGIDRKRLMRYFSKAFVVPDDFDDRVVFGEHGSRQEAAQAPSKTAADGVSITMKAKLASGHLSSAVESVSGRLGHRHGDVHLSAIREAIEREKREDGFMPRHSLLDLVGPEKPVDELLQLASEWPTEQDELLEQTEGVLLCPEVGHRLLPANIDGSVEKLRQLFSALPSDRMARGQRQALLQGIAARTFLSEIGLVAESHEPTVIPTVETPEPDSLRLESLEDPFFSSMPFGSSPPIVASSQALPDYGTPGRPEDAEEEATNKRLLMYAKALNHAPSSKVYQSLVRSHWDLGGDPDQVGWKPGYKLSHEEEMALKRKHKVEAKRRRAEKRKSHIFQLGEFAKTETQPTPTAIRTSQPRVKEYSSQAVPVIAMSQVVAGPHGGRALKKGGNKRKSVGAPGGFR
ncbi:RNA polymerase I-specific transcription initiation factor RRN6-like protein [Podospora appendiculata]|uniref:RNA polymerase I-specific transcription initiation factor RRN6-like protein n=1 Tax=Podospora appendiculata TaxID=314037 RepID=A0AAE1C9N6_9PEZI|nr:RNA polymerase I-specific transcription initiation factor RRN6-like protein [Podospora appendiculata]KAK3684266.1 RNA polymerase I-specific transcription initiation factor RRN6-like protein [Podospora appendiculata]